MASADAIPSSSQIEAASLTQAFRTVTSGQRFRVISASSASRSIAISFVPSRARFSMASVKTPVPGPNSTTELISSQSSQSTISFASASELGATAPTLPAFRKKARINDP